MTSISVSLFLPAAAEQIGSGSQCTMVEPGPAHFRKWEYTPQHCVQPVWTGTNQTGFLSAQQLNE